MNFEKKKFRKLFPHLAKELENKEYRTKINSIRSDTSSGEEAVSNQFAGYNPDLIDFIRRCENKEQVEEIIMYLEKRGEISFEYAQKIRKQLEKQGIRSFGSKKDNDYYLKHDGF